MKKVLLVAALLSSTATLALATPGELDVPHNPSFQSNTACFTLADPEGAKAEKGGEHALPTPEQSNEQLQLTCKTNQQEFLDAQDQNNQKMAAYDKAWNESASVLEQKIKKTTSERNRLQNILNSNAKVNNQVKDMLKGLDKDLDGLVEKMQKVKPEYQAPARTPASASPAPLAQTAPKAPEVPRSTAKITTPEESVTKAPAAVPPAAPQPEEHTQTPSQPAAVTQGGTESSPALPTAGTRSKRSTDVVLANSGEAPVALSESPVAKQENKEEAKAQPQPAASALANAESETVKLAGLQMVADNLVNADTTVLENLDQKLNLSITAGKILSAPQKGVDDKENQRYAALAGKLAFATEVQPDLKAGAFVEYSDKDTTETAVGALAKYKLNPQLDLTGLLRYRTASYLTASTHNADAYLGASTTLDLGNHLYVTPSAGVKLGYLGGYKYNGFTVDPGYSLGGDVKVKVAYDMKDLIVYGQAALGYTANTQNYSATVATTAPAVATQAEGNSTTATATVAKKPLTASNLGYTFLVGAKYKIMPNLLLGGHVSYSTGNAIGAGLSLGYNF